VSRGTDGLCSVSPARDAGSSFTCAEPISTPTHSVACLWIARHAKPLIEPGICYGALDVPADGALTQVAAHALAATLPSDITVRVSPLKRCVQLAESLQTLRPELVFTLDARLREMDFGTWEGVPWAHIPKEAVDAWTADFAHHRFGGKESANEVLARVGAAWDEVRGTPTLWIAHSGVAQAATLLAQGLRHIEQAKDWPASRLGYGDWTDLNVVA
jgi:alpha-ribazole phosphatase